MSIDIFINQIKNKLNYLLILISACIFLFLFGLDFEKSCLLECGEHIIALNELKQFKEYGLVYNLIENYGTVKEPLLYTHNVNIGSYFLIFLEFIGIHDLKIKSIIVLGVFLLGANYIYKYVAYVTSNKFISIITLAFFCFNFFPNWAYALNSLRAWHFLAFFGSCIHLLNYLKYKNSKDILFYSLFVVISFGCGYEYWIITLVFNLITLALIQKENLRIKNLLLILIIFSIPFFLRQFQIIITLGLNFWAYDIFYSLGIKIPIFQALFDYPNLNHIDNFYQVNNIMRPPASFPEPLRNHIDLFLILTQNIIIPRYGILSLFFFLFVLIKIFWNKVKNISNDNYIKYFFIPYLLTIIISFSIFMPFSLHVYIKHEIPLLSPFFYSLYAYIIFLFYKK